MTEDDLDEIGAEGNRIVGGIPKGVLEYVARNIVDDPDGVFVETSERRAARWSCASTCRRPTWAR